MDKDDQIQWSSIDHVVITCADIEQSAAFYGGGLGMSINWLEDGRVEVRFGRCKLNLQPAGERYGPPKNAGRIWSTNICLLVKQGLSDVELHLKETGLRIEEGPVERRGALGLITSLYLYDPDGNLIEISEYRTDAQKI